MPLPRLSLLVLLALIFLPFSGAQAGTVPAPQTTQPVSSETSVPGEPSLVSFGINYVDFDKFNSRYSQGGEARTRSTDFRLEYRFGYSLWSANNDWMNFGIHPLVGGEASTREQLYGFGGLGFDWLLWKHVVLTESEAVGFFDSGNAKPLGSFIEFRSQLECGWRFDNNMRLTGEISHISNAGLTRHNPGEEIVGAYLHIPAAMLFGG
jgi:hypothetical protein